MHLIGILAQQSDLPNAWAMVQTGGVVGVLFLGLYLVLSGRLITKNQFQEIIADRNFWRTLALHSTDLTEAHVKVTETEIPERFELHEAMVTKRLAGIEKALHALGAQGAD